MHEVQWLIFTVIGLALLFDFINGFHDTANAIATSVSTRALHPSHAIIMAAVLNFLGAMYSTGVAKTIGTDIVKSAQHVDEHIIVAALVGAVLWNIITWYFAVPSSSSHALVGGVIGAVLVSVGVEGLNLWGIGKIVIALIASPIFAICTGCIVMLLLCDHAVFQHVSEDQVSSLDRVLRVDQRVIVSGTVGNRTQISDLRQIQLIRRFVKISLTRGSDPVVTVHEIDIVQIEFHDLVLGILLLKIPGNKDLFHLALPGSPVVQEDTSGELHGDRTSALRDLALGQR